MKLMRLIGVSVAAALLFAFPAAAAVSPAYDLVAPILTPDQVIDDCVVSLGLEDTILFVEATQDCDPTMADLTGLCLAPATDPLPARIAAVLAPALDISCTATRPSPPG
ncbi:MAG TPA: hypothetical protein VGN60_09110 [Devosia sp.]|jgi:hypothetical protein|nr:hypothetical protein [Devosia sp.]